MSDVNAFVAPPHARFTAALFDPELPCPAGLVAWNGSDPAARFAVYRNNVVGSLVEALADTFPVTQALVGEPFFAAMAADFARRHPPRSPVLAHYGAGFPAFVAAFEPARDVPYLADVARLEFARVHAFHAADAAPLSTDAVGVALASGERSGELVFTLHPSVGALSSAHAAVSIWAAHQDDDADLEAVAIDTPESALVLREGLDVLVLTASAGAAVFVGTLQRGMPLAHAAARALETDAAFDLAATLALLVARGAIVSIHLPEDANP